MLIDWTGYPVKLELIRHLLREQVTDFSQTSEAFLYVDIRYFGAFSGTLLKAHR